MAWGFGTAAKTIGKKSAKNSMKKSASKAALLGNVGLTGAMFGGMGYMTAGESDNKFAHGGKWAMAGAIDFGSDLAMSGVAMAMAAFGGPVGAAAGTALMIGDTITDVMGLDLSTAFLNATDAMDDSYNRMGAQGGHYKMSQNSSQLMQRQLQNLQGAGSNVAEMMHN